MYLQKDKDKLNLVDNHVNTFDNDSHVPVGVFRGEQRRTSLPKGKQRITFICY